MNASIQDNRTNEFRMRYRTVDVLLIDDIQFLAGKDRTREEFFHTFNALHEIQKQIVVSSDRPPKDIPTLEDRLRSRFEGGLMADIQPADFETRLAILSSKLGPYSRLVPDDVCAFIAHRIQKNIRELEGALIGVLAHASTNVQPVSPQAAQPLTNLSTVAGHPVDPPTSRLSRRMAGALLRPPVHRPTAHAWGPPNSTRAVFPQRRPSISTSESLKLATSYKTRLVTTASA